MGQGGVKTGLNAVSAVLEEPDLKEVIIHDSNHAGKFLIINFFLNYFA